MNKKAITAIAAVLALPMAAAAGPDDDKLVVNEEIEMVTKAAAPAHIADVMDEVMSGWHFRKDETQSLQMDDFENPAMIFVDQALDAWNTVEGSEGKSCASCHDDVEESMKGVRAVYP
ncbi:MAG: sulfur oxidation c-type cytochrome SoxA, partial [Leisingera sp.]